MKNKQACMRIGNKSVSIVKTTSDSGSSFYSIYENGEQQAGYWEIDKAKAFETFGKVCGIIAAENL